MAGAKPAFPRACRRDGAPSLWLAMEGPRRTFAADAGDVADLMGNARAAARSAAVAWAPGPAGPCLDVSAGGYCSVTHAVAGPPLTLSARFCLRGKSGDVGLLVSRDSAFVGLLFSEATGSPLTSSWNGSGAEYAGATGLVPALGRWYYAAGVFLPGSTTTYLGDVAAGTLSSYTLAATNAARSLSNWVFGNDALATSSRWVNGQVDDVRISPRALSAAEVARDFADPYWRLRPARRVAAYLPASAAAAFRPFFHPATRDLSGGLAP